MKDMLDLERKVHNCMKCKQTHLRKILPYPPVYSFGDPKGKEIMVVGQNPSSREYINGYLSNSPNIEERRKSQLTYFEHRKYPYFDEIEKFLGGIVREKIGWVNLPWEKVGYLDLVKCPTTPLKVSGQWSRISKGQQEMLIRNCEGYLKEQLDFYKPKIILPYGADVGKWFAKYLNVRYEQFEDEKARLNNREVNLLFIPQRQGPHSKPEILWVRNKILKILRNKI